MRFKILAPFYDKRSDSREFYFISTVLAVVSSLAVEAFMQQTGFYRFYERKLIEDVKENPKQYRIQHSLYLEHQMKSKHQYDEKGQPYPSIFDRSFRYCSERVKKRALLQEISADNDILFELKYIQDKWDDQVTLAEQEQREKDKKEHEEQMRKKQQIAQQIQQLAQSDK